MRVHLKIDGWTPLRHVDALTRLSLQGHLIQPRTMSRTLSSAVITLGEVAAACERDFAQPNDRLRTETEIGRLLCILSITAQASGTTLAKALATYLPNRPNPPPITIHASPSA